MFKRWAFLCDKWFPERPYLHSNIAFSRQIYEKLEYRIILFSPHSIMPKVKDWRRYGYVTSITFLKLIEYNVHMFLLHQSYFMFMKYRYIQCPVFSTLVSHIFRIDNEKNFIEVESILSKFWEKKTFLNMLVSYKLYFWIWHISILTICDSIPYSDNC